jgi:hypothetical protein
MYTLHNSSRALKSTILFTFLSIVKRLFKTFLLVRPCTMFDVFVCKQCPTIGLFCDSCLLEQLFLLTMILYACTSYLCKMYMHPFKGMRWKVL